MRLKRTPSMPANSASLPRFSSSDRTATAPACASASTIFTPGMIGLPGKWPAQSASVTRLRATTRAPGSSSTHLVEQEERIAVRQDRLDLGLVLEGRDSALAWVQPAQARAGRGGRSTWPFRTGMPSASAISSKLKSSASFRTTTFACAGAISARHAPSSARSSVASARRAGPDRARRASPRRGARSGAPAGAAPRRGTRSP